MPIYLLADVAQAAQCLMRRTAFESVMGYESEFDHVNTDKDLWFRLSLEYDYAYIREKLSLIRVHESRETIKAFRNILSSACTLYDNCIFTLDRIGSGIS